MRGKGFFRNLIRHPIRTAKEGISGLYDEIVKMVREGEQVSVGEKKARW
jgi:hypothetical protein